MMEFEEEANVKPADSVMHYEGFKLVCDAKSLLYLFGMSLDYSNALIGEIDFTSASAGWHGWPDNAESTVLALAAAAAACAIGPVYTVLHGEH